MHLSQFTPALVLATLSAALPAEMSANPRWSGRPRLALREADLPVWKTKVADYSELPRLESFAYVFEPGKDLPIEIQNLLNAPAAKIEENPSSENLEKRQTIARADLHSDFDFSGSRYIMSVQTGACQDIGSIPGWENVVSSVTTYGTLARFMFFEDLACQGTSLVVQGLSLPNLADFGFNDRISSILWN